MPTGKGEIFLGPIVSREENKRVIRAERGFPGGSMVKKPPELQVQSLGQKDALEKETASHSSVLACRIPWTEEPGGLWSVGLQRVGHNLATKQQLVTVGGTLFDFDLFLPCFIIFPVMLYSYSHSLLPP